MVHDENEMDGISHISDGTTFEQFIEWCKKNNKIVAIVVSAMLFHTFILIGIIAAINSGNSTDIYESAHPPHQAYQPVTEPVEESVCTTEEPEDSIMDNSEVHEDDSTLPSAFEAGVQTGEILIEARDMLTDFLQGFNEATDAAAWTRERWDSGRERVSRWLEENRSAADDINIDETDTDIADIDDED